VQRMEASGCRGKRMWEEKECCLSTSKQQPQNIEHSIVSGQENKSDLTARAPQEYFSSMRVCSEVDDR
jgi:hypothetical protein